MPQADAGAVFLQNALFFCPVLYYNKLEKFRDCPGCTYYKDGVILLHTVLLVFDIGTSGLKASLVDERLNILRNVTTTYPTHYLPGGGVEQDAADWWMSAVRAMLMLRELVPEYLKQVDAIGVSGHMLGLLPMDGEGQTLRPAIIRRDTRAKAVTETLLDRFGADYFYRISGNVLTPNLTLSKAVWLHENEPEVYEKTVRFLQCKDYLVYRLTGSMDTTDFSDASRAGLMNLQTRDYDYDMLETLSLHAEKFPTIRPGCAGDTVTLRFRVGNVYKNKKIAVYRGDTCIYSRKRPVLAPGEMETVRLKAELLQGPGEAVTVTLEEG